MKPEPLKDQLLVDLAKIRYNENYVVLGMRAMSDPVENAGPHGTKYSILGEVNTNHRLIIQVFSFNENLGIQNLRKNKKFRVQGKIHYYNKGGREIHSIYAEQIHVVKG